MLYYNAKSTVIFSKCYGALQPVVLTVQLKTLEYSDLYVFSPQWERKEAGGGVPHLQLEMKDVVGAILPTLPQSPRSPQNPPALHPPRHKTHPKTAARRRRRRPRARRTSQLQEGKKVWTNEAPLLVCAGVREKTWSSSRSAFGSFHLQSQSDQRLGTAWLNLIFHLCISFKCRQDRQSFHLCAWLLITFTKTTTTPTKKKCIPCISLLVCPVLNSSGAKAAGLWFWFAKLGHTAGSLLCLSRIYQEEKPFSLWGFFVDFHSCFKLTNIRFLFFFCSWSWQSSQTEVRNDIVKDELPWSCCITTYMPRWV